MPDFTSEDLSGSRFEDVRLADAWFHDVGLTNARFHLADLTNARFQLVDLTGVMIRGAALVNVDISGEIENLRVNGVDVVPLVEAELNRRYPDRVKMRPADADGFREAWDILERLWQRTVGRARGMAPDVLHERVDGEWSFIETLRHLVFATDAWVRRAILGEPSPWDPLDLPHDEMPDEPSVPRDRGARPSLDEVLALRADRMATVRQVIADLTDAKLAGLTEPVMEPGYPVPESFAVRRCLQAILNEEWEHRLYAERAPVWLDAARDFSEYWTHQQQICDATGRPGLTGPQYLGPVLDTFMRALPHTLRHVTAAPGTVLQMTVTGPSGGEWTCTRGPDRWALHRQPHPQPTARAELDADTAWRLCTRGITPERAAGRARIAGDQRLAAAALQIVSIIWSPPATRPRSV